MFTTDVENYPGFPEKVTGQELMSVPRQAEHQGTGDRHRRREPRRLSAAPLQDLGRRDRSSEAHGVIATGARANYLGLPNEDALKNRASAPARSATARLFRGQLSSSSAAATPRWKRRRISPVRRKVMMIHRRDEFRASKVMQDRAQITRRSKSSTTSS